VLPYMGYIGIDFDEFGLKWSVFVTRAQLYFWYWVFRLQEAVFVKFVAVLKSNVPTVECHF